MNHMAVLNGCEDKRNAVTIEEVKCPKCGAGADFVPDLNKS